jgi:hypothetical protein
MPSYTRSANCAYLYLMVFMASELPPCLAQEQGMMRAFATNTPYKPTEEPVPLYISSTTYKGRCSTSRLHQISTT